MFSQNPMSTAQQPSQPQMNQQHQLLQRADPPIMQGLSNPEAPTWHQPKSYHASRPGDFGANQSSMGQPSLQQLQQAYNLNTQSMSTSGPYQPQRSVLPNFSNLPMTAQQVNSVFGRNPMMQMSHLQTIVPQSAPNQQAPNGIDLSRLQQMGFTQCGAKQPGDADMMAQSNIPLNQDQMHGPPHVTTHPVGSPNGAQGQGRLQNGLRRIPIHPGVQDELFQQTRVTNQQLSNGMLPNMRLNSMGISPQIQQSAGGATQQTFVAHPNSPAAPVFGIKPPGNITGHQQNPASLNAQAPRPMVRPNVPVHSGGVPYRPSNGQVNNDMSLDMAQGNQFTSLQTNAQIGLNQARPPVMPLEKSRFESTYAHFCRSQGRQPIFHVQMLEHSVDLFKLHAAVMHEGGMISVNQRERWPVIGGLMNFVHFPGNDPEPGRCGPVVAQQLQHIYREHLQEFESAYVMTMCNRGPGSQQPPQRGVFMGPGNGVPLSRTNHQHALAHSPPRLNGSDSPAPVPSIPGHVQINATPGVRPSQSMGPVLSVPIDEQKASATQSGSATMYVTPNDIQVAQGKIASLRRAIEATIPPVLPMQQLPEDQPAYKQLLDDVYKLLPVLNGSLVKFLVVRRHEAPHSKLLALVKYIPIVIRQRQLLYSSPPQFIIASELLKQIGHEIHRFNIGVAQMTRFMDFPALTNSTQTNPPPAPSNRTIPMPIPVTVAQSTSVTPPVHTHQVPLNPPPPPVPQHMPQTSKKPAQPSVPSSPPIPLTPATIPSPASHHVTPVPTTNVSNAPTPTQTAGSPHTQKSPKARVAARPRVAPRIRKPSSSVPGSTTPDATSGPITGVKRSSEDIVPPTTLPFAPDGGYAHSPKKVKTEWEGETSEALLKKQQEVEGIKTDEETTAFFDRMKELLAITASSDNSVNSDIAATLDQILAGVAGDPANAAATAAAISARVVGDCGSLSSTLSPPGLASDEFSEFIDFSSFTTLEDEENDSKAPTPDLVPSSEANPSPESGSDAEPLGSTSLPDKIKFEALTDQLDPLRLGPLKGIDGGESAYYHPDNWKWEGPMPTLEQPWAMYTSS